MEYLSKTNNHIIVNKIISTLSRIGQVEYRITPNVVRFYRNHMLFGKFEAGILYLANSVGKLVKFSANCYMHGDFLLKIAKEAYHSAKNKVTT